MLKIWQPVSLKDYADYGNLNTLDNKKECIIVTFKKTSKCLTVYDEERDRDQLTKSWGALFCRLQKTGNVALTENCQRGIQQIAAHAHRSFGKWNLHIRYLMAFVMLLESFIISIGVFTQQIDGRRTKCVSNCSRCHEQKLQIVFNCGHCADRSRADVIYVPRYSDHAACSNIQGQPAAGQCK